MPRHFHDLKDLVIASGILLVVLAGKAGGQVGVAFVDKEEPLDPRHAILALERSRESLLQARESIDAALLEVDRALLAIASTRRSAAQTAMREAPARDPVALFTAKAAGFLEAVGAGLVEWVPRVLDAVGKPGAALAHRDENTGGAALAAPETAIKADPGRAGTDPAALTGAPAPPVDPAPETSVAGATPSPAVAREQGAGETPREEIPARSEALRLPDLLEAVKRLGLTPAPRGGHAPEATQR